MARKPITITEIVKQTYRAGNLNSVCASCILKKADHWPKSAQKIVAELIKEKHNGP